MLVRQFTDARAFYDWVAPFLVEREAAHNLLLGISNTLINHPDRYEEAPYLASFDVDERVAVVAMRTPPHNVVLSETDEPEAPRQIAAHLHQVYSALPGVLSPATIAREFAQHWSDLSSQRFSLGTAQRIYKLDRVTPHAKRSGVMRIASPEDRDLLISWLTTFADETGRENHTVDRTVDWYLASHNAGLVLWCDPQPVSMAGFGGPTPNNVYLAIGYEPVCDVDEYRFLPAE